MTSARVPVGLVGTAFTRWQVAADETAEGCTASDHTQNGHPLLTEPRREWVRERRPATEAMKFAVVAGIGCVIGNRPAIFPSRRYVELGEPRIQHVKDAWPITSSTFRRLIRQGSHRSAVAVPS